MTETVPPDQREHTRKLPRWQQLTVRTRLVVLLVALTLAAVAVSGLVSYGLQRAALQSRVDDSLIRTVEEVRILAADGIDPETGEAFIESDRLVYVAMQRQLPGEHESMIGINPAGVAWTAPTSVELRLEEDEQLVTRLIELAQPANFDPDVRLLSLSTNVTDYRAAVIPVTFPGDEQLSLLVMAYDVRQTVQELNGTFITYGITGLGVLVVVTLFGIFGIGRQLAPLRTLQETAARISEEDLNARVPIVGEDDVAALSKTFNDMLDRVQGAFRSQRQLLDDVGHELRTPITIVQGNLELLDANDPDDVEQVKAISLDELDRVAGLIEDLVTLAKVDRPEFVKPKPIDVHALTHEIAEKASQLGNREWSVDSAAQLVYDLDNHRITQAWLQLANNAVKYSDEGTRVSIGSRVDAAGSDARFLHLWVRDEGIGIEPEDRDRIFERFGRGKNSTRAEGSGLGLNIVSEIVRTHGGTVTVDSVPGVGSVFTMRLPLNER